jgi:hypothetical protein
VKQKLGVFVTRFRFLPSLPQTRETRACMGGRWLGAHPGVLGDEKEGLVEVAGDEEEEVAGR